MEIKLKRIYQAKEDTDGFRILVDKIYPRGIKKENLQVDLWDKEIAPSDTLRKAFHTSDDREELSQNPHTTDFLQLLKGKEVVTLLTASKDINHCQLPILKAFIEDSEKETM